MAMLPLPVNMPKAMGLLPCIVYHGRMRHSKRSSPQREEVVDVSVFHSIGNTARTCDSSSSSSKAAPSSPPQDGSEPSKAASEDPAIDKLLSTPPTMSGKYEAEDLVCKRKLFTEFEYYLEILHENIRLERSPTYGFFEKADPSKAAETVSSMYSSDTPKRARKCLKPCKCCANNEMEATKLSIKREMQSDAPLPPRKRGPKPKENNDFTGESSNSSNLIISIPSMHSSTADLSVKVKRPVGRPRKVAPTQTHSQSKLREEDEDLKPLFQFQSLFYKTNSSDLTHNSGDWLENTSFSRPKPTKASKKASGSLNLNEDLALDDLGHNFELLGNGDQKDLEDRELQGMLSTLLTISTF